MNYTIIDTYPAFRNFWEKEKDKPINEQIESWIEEYMSNYPELLKLQVKCYKDLKVNWRKVAKERIFPKIPDYYVLMKKARNKLCKIIPEAYNDFTKFWNLNISIVFVIYVGLGCGAGWATKYLAYHAVLLGLENIVELGWTSARSLKGLLLHELSHIAHMALRKIDPEEYERLTKDPLFLLYSEGFATRCEHLILGREEWRIAPSRKWLKWCRDNMYFLAHEYLKRVREGKDVNDFFGSWLNIKGKSQTGYYLGHEIVKVMEIEGKRSIEEVASMKLNDVRENVKRILENLAKVYEEQRK